jgi:hypothetical protein
MDFSNTVKLLEKLYRIRERLLWRDKLSWNPLLEADCDIGRLVGSFQRVIGHGPHVIWRRLIRVFQNTSFIAAVGKICILTTASRSFRPLNLLKNLLSLHGAIILMEGWIA